MMLECRRTTKVEGAPQRVLEFWEWYGLNTLAKAARKDWPWWDETAHTRDWMVDCVSVSDEALALQVLHLRGDAYVLMKGKHQLEMAKPEEQRAKQKGGRKKRTVPRGDKPGSQATLCETVDMYVSYHGMVKDARRADPEDDLGWYKFLRKKAVAKRVSAESRGGKKKIIEIVDIPVDDVSFLTAKRCNRNVAVKAKKKAKV